jgi:hypothetical protein
MQPGAVPRSCAARRDDGPCMRRTVLGPWVRLLQLRGRTARSRGESVTDVAFGYAWRSHDGPHERRKRGGPPSVRTGVTTPVDHRPRRPVAVGGPSVPRRTCSIVLASGSAYPRSTPSLPTDRSPAFACDSVSRRNARTLACLSPSESCVRAWFPSSRRALPPSRGEASPRGNSVTCVAAAGKAGCAEPGCRRAS